MVPRGSSRGTSSSVADRFVSRLASSVESRAMPSRAAYDVVVGQRVRHQVAEGAGRERRDHHAEAEHEDREARVRGAHRPAVRRGRRRGRPHTTSTTAVAPDTQNGSTPSGESAAKPTSITRTATTGVRAWPGGSSGRVRVGRTSQVGAVQQPEHDVLDDQDHGQHRRHPQGEAAERQVEVGHRQQVGQVRDRQQQGGRVGHPDAGLRAGPVRNAERDRGRHDHRGDQDDGRVEAEHGRDQRGQEEDAGEQPDRVVAAQGHDVVRRGGEDARPGADLGHDQDRDQERDHRAEVAQDVLDVLTLEQAGGQGDRHGSQADERLDPPGRMPVRRGQQGPPTRVGGPRRQGGSRAESTAPVRIAP